MGNYIEKFRSSITSWNLEEAQDIWNKMSTDEKITIKKQIASLPNDMQRDIHLRLSSLSEELAIDIMGEVIRSVQVKLDNKYFSAKEIRDSCLINIKTMPRFVIAIFELSQAEKNSILEEIRLIDNNFYKSISISIKKLENYIKQRASTKDKKTNVLIKTPITYIIEYLDNKAEALGIFKKKLIEMGLTSEETNRILEIEASILSPKDFG